MSRLNFGTVDRCSVKFNTATLLGLQAAYENFSTTDQDPRNFEIGITDEREARGAPMDEHDVISVTFVARMLPGMRGLGNASPLGTSVKYVVSP
ncbi:hypothetical protein [Burkholderia sp. Bp9142]|uniref:hypothetical protein n=1 Tax=Burkholderia sp. Bp9142 TaxID=2184573 RepID=UPI000F5915F8|nr:hypothetical protein [Burkholderia sp. Bp9142]RQR24161.1 hypothetical protein DIE22_36610 [Burkholderia sp. Bp9142]